MILHTYWPHGRPEDMRTVVIVDADTIEAAHETVEAWWGAPIGRGPRTWNMSGPRLVRMQGDSLVTLPGVEPLRWRHLTYEASVEGVTGDE